MKTGRNAEKIKDRISNFPGLFLLIILAGAVLRFYDLGKDSLWFDELSTWETTRSDVMLKKNPLDTFSFDKYEVNPAPRTISDKLTVIHKNIQADRIHLPLYFFCLYFVKSCIGDSEFSLRLLSCLFGILAIILIYFTARLFYSKTTALTSAALMAFLWFPIYYSREVRMYSMMLFFCLLSTYLVILFYNSVKKSRPRYLVMALHIVASGIAAYLHFTAFFYIVLQWAAAFFLLINIKKQVRTYYIIVTVFLFFLLTLFVPAFMAALSVIRDNAQIPNILWLQSPNPEDFMLIFNAYLNYPHHPFLAYYHPKLRESAILINFILLLCVVFLFRQYHRNVKNKISFKAFAADFARENRNDLFLLCWLLIPVTLLFFISMLKFPLYIDRYLVFAIPPLYILIGRVIGKFSTKKWITRSIVVVLFLLAAVDLFGIKKYYSSANKTQYREIVAFIAGQSLQYPGAMAASNQGSYGLEYYFKKFKIDDLPCFTYQACYTGNVNNPYRIEEVNELLAQIGSGQYNYLWYISAFSCIDKLEFENLQLLSRKEFFNATISLYKINQTGNHIPGH